METIWFEPRIVKKGVDVVRKMKSLTKIKDRASEEFWKQYDAGAFTK